MSRFSGIVLLSIVVTISVLSIWVWSDRQTLMRGWILKEDGVWWTQGGFNGDIPPPNAYDLPDIANLKKYDGKYRRIRPAMIAAGWTPFHSMKAQECREGFKGCEGRPEMLSCAGTGIGTCSYLWQKDNVTIAIYASESGVHYDGHSLISVPIVFTVPRAVGQ